MSRISHGCINATIRRESDPDNMSKKITTNNMNGTLNATTRRNVSDTQTPLPQLPTQPNVPQLPTQPNVPQLPTQPCPNVQPPQPDVQPPQPAVVPRPRPNVQPPQPSVVLQPQLSPQPAIVQPVIQSQETLSTQDILEIKDQYVKMSMSLNQINGLTNTIKKDLNSYKKITDDRIEKIANLFLSINKE